MMQSFIRHSNKSSIIYVGFVVVVWISSSSVTQIYNKKSLLDGVSPITLVFCQMLFGLLLNMFINKFINEESSSMFYTQFPINEISEIPKNEHEYNILHIIIQPKWLMLIIGTFNALGHLLTMWSTIVIAPAFTHTIRSIEPVFICIFSYVILSEKVTHQQFLSLIPMILGVAIIANSHKNTLSYDENSRFNMIFGVMLGLFADISIALRNCLSKLFTIKTSIKLKYSQICTESSKIMVILFLILLIFYPISSFTISYSLAIATVTHIIYSSSSFYILSLMNPLSHAIVKFSSRTFAIIAVAIIFSVSLSFQSVLGIALSLTGAYIYVLASQNVMTGPRIAMFLIFIFTTMCTYAYLYPNTLSIPSFNQTIRIPGTINSHGTSDYGHTNSTYILDFNYDGFRESALMEVQVDKNNDYPFQYPMFPIKGYKACLIEIFPSLEKPKGGDTLYIGDKNQMYMFCSSCKHIEIDTEVLIIDQISRQICLAKQLICGPNSSSLCGLFGVMNRTPTIVDNTELSKWPVFMKDFTYGDAIITSKTTIRDNHRLFMDRHTIQASHPILKKSYQIADPHSPFGVLIYYTDEKQCKFGEDHITTSGNVGDAFNTHLAGFFSQELDLSFSEVCLNTQQTKFSVGLTGSIAQRAVSQKNIIVLGMGAISKTALQNEVKHFSSSAYVMGVRGTNTRDSFIYSYNINPEVVGDPGLWLSLMKREWINKARYDGPLRPLCFIAHYVDIKFFKQEFVKIVGEANVMNAEVDIEKFVKFIAQCQHVVSSSLHGAIFSHSLGTPAMVIRVSGQVVGGDWKYQDYYWGINVTTFENRWDWSKQKHPTNIEEWIALIKNFPNPVFPIYDKLVHLKRFASVFLPREDIFKIVY